MSGDLDIIFSSKIPGRQKFRHLEEMGFQQLEKVQSNKKFGLFSTFEFGRTKGKESQDFQHILVSNSLAIRREWLSHAKGKGEKVRVNLAGSSVEGIFEDIDMDGCLLLRHRDGTIQKISAGDVFFPQSFGASN